MRLEPLPRVYGGGLGRAGAVPQRLAGFAIGEVVGQAGHVNAPGVQVGLSAQKGSQGVPREPG